ncbi:MAG: T9SS type A sorting domain-containing protein, partial [Ignavibacteria bacterium]|nr:T9SS type A sorting domain-containing protein [Ignavibacteria bacterium]
NNLTPSELYLSQNYPNPFNPSTTINFSVPKLSFISISVYDVLGNEIAILVNEEKPAGTFELTWNAENLPSGIYFYKLKTGNFIDTKKMILLR